MSRGCDALPLATTFPQASTTSALLAVVLLSMPTTKSRKTMMIPNGCCRNQLLVASSNLILGKALIPDLEQAGAFKAKFIANILQLGRLW
jgi:hypothetical protein